MCIKESSGKALFWNLGSIHQIMLRVTKNEVLVTPTSLAAV
jgi:hypothetical protein